jgi:hypothetical protein
MPLTAHPFTGQVEVVVGDSKLAQLQETEELEAEGEEQFQVEEEAELLELAEDLR